MVGKKKKSLQFADTELEELQKALSQDPGTIKAVKEGVVRHTFRVQCEKEDAAFVEIAGKTYPVVNIGDSGIGILVPDDSIFSGGEELPEIVFSFREQTMVLKGCVVHVSMEDKKAYLCGISLQEMSEEQEKKLLTLVQQQRLALFGRK